MKTKFSNELVEEFQELNTSQQREVLDFVHFLRVKEAIDPTQAYFWSRQWQQLEREADRAKVRGKRLGDGTVSGLLKALHTKS